MERAKNFIIFISVTLGLAFVISGCASSKMDGYRQLKPKMEKVDVTELLGSPATSFRRKDRDIWIYKFIVSGKEVHKELHFKKGRLVYRGKPVAHKKIKTKADREFEEYKKGVEKDKGFKKVD